jgi:hypothetical protein
MRVQVRDPCILGAALEKLPYPGVGQRSFPPQPQRLGSRGEWMLPAGLQVATQRIGSADPEWHSATAAAFPHHQRKLLAQVNIVKGEPNQLGGSDPGVDEHADDRLVATVLQTLTLAGGDECDQLSVGQDRHRLLRHRWRRHALHRVAGDFAVVDEEPEQLLQRSVVTRSNMSARKCSMCSRVIEVTAVGMRLATRKA